MSGMPSGATIGRYRSARGPRRVALLERNNWNAKGRDADAPQLGVKPGPDDRRREATT